VIAAADGFVAEHRAPDVVILVNAVESAPVADQEHSPAVFVVAALGEASLVEELAAGVDKDGAHVAHVVVGDLLGHLESVLQQLAHAERVAVADQILTNGEHFRLGVASDACVFDCSGVAADDDGAVMLEADDAGHDSRFQR